MRSIEMGQGVMYMIIMAIKERVLHEITQLEEVWETCWRQVLRGSS